MRRDRVAIIVTVEVYPGPWSSTYGGEYDADDVVTYVREQVEQSGAVVSGCMSPNVTARFRREPK